MLENNCFCEAHILAPIIVEFFKSFFLFLCFVSRSFFVFKERTHKKYCVLYFFSIISDNKYIYKQGEQNYGICNRNYGRRNTWSNGYGVSCGRKSVKGYG